jgi:predicted DNA binding CopG/RHH family protein
MSSSSSRKNNTSKPFCVVCRDAGRPEKEYTSHYVKDQPGPNGKVVCPTLLNQACRICAKPGHTSSYCPEYRGRREERYIEREPRREERYIERPRREERYIEREQPPRREEKPRYSYNDLREDTERREREIQYQNERYNREEERRSKPWLQAALKSPQAPEQQQRRRHEPYAHPHGPRVRLNLETTALCASKHAVEKQEETQEQPRIDVRKVEFRNSATTHWDDDDVNEPFDFDPEKMFNEFAQEFSKREETVTLRPESDLRRIRAKAEAAAQMRVSEEEFKFIEMCDNQNEMPFNCGQ